MDAKSLHTSAKRGLALLLALILLFSFVPMQAFASGYPENVPMEPSVEPEPTEAGIMPLSAIPVNSWAGIATELNAANAPDGSTIIIALADNIPTQGHAAITIGAIGRELDVTITSGMGGPFALTRANAGRHFIVSDGSTLRLENVTLSGNYPDTPTNHGGIQVNAGGSLYMEAGSVITRNRFAGAGQGGGVTLISPPADSVSLGGSFTMNSGEISLNSGINIPATGNTTGIVGGVFVGNTATFTMNSGVIRNNWGRFGGGVAVGTPTGVVNTTRMYMHGGEIYGNTAFFGGAVNIERGALTMTDGIIRNNSVSARNNDVAITTLVATRGGGGVFIQNNGIFNMSDGTIHSNHSYTHGGGVMSITAANQFNMTGGTIRDNTAANTGGGVRMTNGVFTMASGTLDDGTIIYGTITGNTAANDGGGVWLNTAAQLNLNTNIGIISNNTATYGNGGGIFTVANNSYPASLLATHYPNILATAPFAVTFSGNSAGGGKFAPPANAFNRPFGDLLNNYDINYIGQTQVALIAFMLNGGYVNGSPASIIDIIPLTEELEVPEPEKPFYELIGWILLGDETGTILSAEDIENMPITGSKTFVAQWEPLDPITITYLSGTNGTFAGGATSATELLIATGDYPAQVPTPIADNGFQFIGWSRDGGATLYYTAEVMALFINTDTMFTAHWEPSTGGGVGGGARPPQTVPSRQAYLIGTDGQIRPNANITRAEVATIFFRLIDDTDRTANWTQTNPFSDVILENWFNNGISTTTQMGIFQGRPDGTFGPNQAITRAELAAAVARFADVIGLLGTEEDLFNDIYRHWANAYINTLAAQNWVQGPYGQGGAFYPDHLITRAETAAILNRMFGRLPESPADLLPDMNTWPDNANTSAWYYLYLQSASNSYTYEIKADGIHERWIAIIPVRNWAVLERPDSVPGDIM